jgi:4-hydroxy-tetrahydrodipicolinate reductase
METIIFGGGRLGTAIAATLRERGESAPTILGRPELAHGDDRARIAARPPADVAFECSRGDAVAANVAAALDAGTCRFVIATTGWASDRTAVERLLLDRGAAAVASPNFSLGMHLFGRLVDRAVELFGPLADFDPYLVEWHRAAKPDRPSGTARELAQRIVAAHPRKQRIADPGRPGSADPAELELAVVRAGASPGVHTVGFDAPGETVELRLTARDRSAYAAGAVAAADWLRAARRSPGIHDLDGVVDELLGAAAPRLVAVG